MFRPDRLLVRTDSCTAVPVPVPVEDIYSCICIYACMRAVQNCMLARGSAPEKFYRLCQYQVQAVEIGTEPIKLKSVYVQVRPINFTNRLAIYSLDQLINLMSYNWHSPVFILYYDIRIHVLVVFFRIVYHS